MNRLKDRVAVVTGAAGGIGRAIVERLAGDGAKVVLADLDEDGARDLVTAIGYPDLWAVRMDITRTIEVTEALAQVRERWQTVDILVNNAGRTRVGDFVTSSEAHWGEMLEIDVMGMLRCTQGVLPAMIERRWGRIINIASDVALTGLAGQAVYAATKGAVISFTKSLAREVASSGVLVNAVSPGPVNTPPLQRLFERQPELAAKLIDEIPMGRVAEAVDVAAAVSFLTSDDSGYITGQVLSVNGGWVM